MKRSQLELEDVLRRMASGFLVTQVLYTAARLGIADRLGKGRRSSVQLARSLRVSRSALHRFMRMMVAMQLLDQAQDQSFRLSRLGQYLRSDHPRSLHERALYIGQVNYPAAQEMLHTIRTGEPAFDRVFAQPFFDFLSSHPDLGALFDKQMGANVAERAPPLVAAYDFGKASTVIDIGGGNATLLVAILRAHPQARGILFDSPKVVAEARKRLLGAGLAKRCRATAGDFFLDAIPIGGDIYILSNILHDWDDARSLEILKRCRSAMSPSSRLLVVEEIMPQRVSGAPATVASDFSMLLLTRGMERTVAQYRRLLGRAGFRLSQVVPFEPTRIYSGRRKNWAVLECRTSKSPARGRAGC